MKRFWSRKGGDSKEAGCNEEKGGAEGLTEPRTGRFAETSQGWYVKTRELTDLGPFPSLEYAQDSLQDYIRTVTSSRQRQQTAEFKLGMSVHDAASCRKLQCAECIEGEERLGRLKPGQD